MANRGKKITWSLVDTGKLFDYYVGDDGSVFKRALKNRKESPVKVFLQKGVPTVKINGKERTLKNLVAKHHKRGWKPRMFVEVKNGDPFDCSAKNLRMYTPKEHARRTSHLAKSRAVIIEGVKYRSIKEAARHLYVSDQTIHDYMKRRVNHSVLEGYTAEFV